MQLREDARLLAKIFLHNSQNAHETRVELVDRKAPLKLVRANTGIFGIIGLCLLVQPHVSFAL